MAMNDLKTIYIIYDGECPFCSDFVKGMRIKNAADQLQLINARVEPYLHLLNNQTYDLNEGMLVIIDGQYYHAAAAVHILSMMTTPLSFINKMNFLLFKNPFIAKLYYPVCRFIRNLALRIKGVPPI
ncbi:MAG: DCC1-like thiol-disulfide oxidoreductase family protein [Candidatus Berkiella sp.]